MSWLRLEAKEFRGSGRIYDGVCETIDDLDDAETAAVYDGSNITLASGSMAYCLASKKLYIFDDGRSWQEVGS